MYESCGERRSQKKYCDKIVTTDKAVKKKKKGDGAGEKEPGSDSKDKPKKGGSKASKGDKSSAARRPTVWSKFGQTRCFRMSVR